MKIVILVTMIIDCSLLFSQAVADILGITEPNPRTVENETTACLQMEFQPLAELVVSTAHLIAHTALGTFVMILVAIPFAVLE